jgi:hypothetical protein
MVLDEPSFGWAFKPIVIFDALNMMDNEDFLLWVDSNDILINNPQALFDRAKMHNIYLHNHFPANYKNSQWTTKNMFVKMNADTEKYWNAPHIQVNIMAFCKTQLTMSFVSEWVSNAIDYDVIIRNDMQNLPNFIDHRHEQSICSILAEKYNVPLFFGYPHEVAQEVD